MRAPRMRQQVMLENPGPPVVDPVTGNERPGPPIATPSRAYLEQRSLYAQQEYQASQSTATTDFILLVPAGTPLTMDSTVIDEAGARYVVVGHPAERRARLNGGRVRYIAAWLRLVSDLQGVS
ncbi:hypothetical protein GCM10010470_02390 [Saccharopolyspora taberi]|uniref:Head-to-tail stopper n=2 Tax=Saccharopolyspora taberi TaxID=60895 RepID=A0ABN3V1N8_9PSEU